MSHDQEEELRDIADKFDRNVDSLVSKAHKEDRFWSQKEMDADPWFDRTLDLGEGWDTTTPGIILNPRNYQRLARNEVVRVHRIVARELDKLCKEIATVEHKREARMRKELREEMAEMKTKMLDEARAEIRKAVDAGEAVVNLGELRRHGRRAA
jgi:cell division protein ZapA (FtsZ GTPase activity inhibitor)